MNTADHSMKSRISRQEALFLLEQAWAYFTPERLIEHREERLELFQYANAR
ncbi:hypothetical protein [Ruegeria marina]|uniref:Uncharacterized protein n=1 Tax=Ruegeria marina TaxID=639004 RepID=A0A1G6M8Q0_9RHOB|nr:hypothetical protein [Ruegeria marina]SDC51972.1 hypothetical protein SAMN04488239_102426 [Ruegeria marina]